VQGPDPQDLPVLPPLPWDPTKMSYLVAGRETCPTTGRIHWQGYMETKEPRTMSAIKKWDPFWTNAHFEASFASTEENITYCKKDGDWEEMGTPMRQGRRNDLQRLVRELQAGSTSIEAIVRENATAYHQYGRTLEAAVELQASVATRRPLPRNVVWIWGPTGMGKSRLARLRARDDPHLYVHAYDNNNWWETYEGQRTALFDDFSGEISYRMWLRLTDRYEMKVPRRGTRPRPWLADTIYVTADKSPFEAWPNMTVKEAEQLDRRLTEVIHLQVPYLPTPAELAWEESQLLLPETAPEACSPLPTPSTGTPLQRRVRRTSESPIDDPCSQLSSQPSPPTATMLPLSQKPDTPCMSLSPISWHSAYATPHLATAPQPAAPTMQPSSAAPTSTQACGPTARVSRLLVQESPSLQTRTTTSPSPSSLGRRASATSEARTAAAQAPSRRARRIFVEETDDEFEEAPYRAMTPMVGEYPDSQGSLYCSELDDMPTGMFNEDDEE